MSAIWQVEAAPHERARPFGSSQIDRARADRRI